MDHGIDWETNTYAGLEHLDDEGQDRVSQLGTFEVEGDEPTPSSDHLADLGELELAAQPPRLA